MKKPSVTELCDILNKPALISWANKIGLSGKSIKAYSLSKLKSGAKMHSQIENYFKHGECMDDLQFQNKIDSIFYGCEIISVEEDFENDQYLGRCDIIFKKDGVTYVADFKSSFKKPYLEHYIQLICYKNHFKSDRIAIIDLKNFRLIELSIDQQNEITELIQNLINIYKIKQKVL
jgi:hypothetical protein